MISCRVVAGNMDMRDAQRCQCIEDRIDDGLRRGPACHVPGARTIACWRVGYWVVGSEWLNWESEDGFTMVRPHTENGCCGYGLPTFAPRTAASRS